MNSSYQLNVLKYLEEHSLEDLTNQFAIKVIPHPAYPLFILNYDQLNSPKTHPIVMECRGLVLKKEGHNFSVAAKPFTRFFNFGEAKAITDAFVWNKPFTSISKEDGTLIIVYHAFNQWFANTRQTFGDHKCFESPKTFSELFWDSLADHCQKFFNPNLTYCFEFCSLANKVVREYRKPTSYLLNVIDNNTLQEYPLNVFHFIAKKIGAKLPSVYNFPNYKTVIEFINEVSKKDVTFEGLVLQDCNGLRIKIKNKQYIALAALKGPNNQFSVKHILQFVLKGEKEELLTYFPEVKNLYEKIEKEVNYHLAELEYTWLNAVRFTDRKEFALYITKKRKTLFTFILFDIYNKNIRDKDKGIAELRKQFLANGDKIYKYLFKKKEIV